VPRRINAGCIDACVYLPAPRFALSSRTYAIRRRFTPFCRLPLLTARLTLLQTCARLTRHASLYASPHPPPRPSTRFAHAPLTPRACGHGNAARLVCAAPSREDDLVPFAVRSLFAGTGCWFRHYLCLTLTPPAVPHGTPRAYLPYLCPKTCATGTHLTRRLSPLCRCSKDGLCLDATFGWRSTGLHAQQVLPGSRRDKRTTCYLGAVSPLSSFRFSRAHSPLRLRRAGTLVLPLRLFPLHHKTDGLRPTGSTVADTAFACSTPPPGITFLLSPPHHFATVCQHASRLLRRRTRAASAAAGHFATRQHCVAHTPPSTAVARGITTCVLRTGLTSSGV